MTEFDNVENKIDSINTIDLSIILLLACDPSQFPLESFVLPH